VLFCCCCCSGFYCLQPSHRYRLGILPTPIHRSDQHQEQAVVGCSSNVEGSLGRAATSAGVSWFLEWNPLLGLCT